MPDVLKAGMMLHLRLHDRHRRALLLLDIIIAIVVLVVITTAFVRKVRWAFAFIRSTILKI